jgi:hypothetical protein
LPHQKEEGSYDVDDLGRGLRTFGLKVVEGMKLASERARIASKRGILIIFIMVGFMKH